MISLPYEYPNKKLALLGDNISYDMLVQQGIANLAQKNGWEIVLNDTCVFGSLDFGAQLARVHTENPAIIFACITATDAAVAFVNQFVQNPTDSLLFLRWAPVASEFIKLLGAKANGILWQTEYAYLPTKENIIWAKEFREEFGREPGAAWPALMDDMLHIWICAVEAAGDPKNYGGIIEYVRNLSQHPYQGRAGRYGINPERNEGLTGSEWLPIHFYQIQDQKNVLLFLGNKPFAGSDAVPAGKFQVPFWIRNKKKGGAGRKIN
jgi:branched-chain amino acid transport system substrate-binding protein